MKKIIVSSGLLLSIILFSSCELLFGKYDKKGTEKEEPVYTPNYAWQLQLDGRQLWSQVYTEGQYFYILEFIVEKTEEKIRLAKIDMDTGKYVWRSSKVFSGKNLNFSFSDVIKVHDKLYYTTPDGNMYCHSDIDGSLKAVIQLGNTKKEAVANIPFHSIITDGTNIYWCSNANGSEYKSNVFKLSISKINFADESNIQTIIPESLYATEELKKGRFSGSPIIDNGVLYFLTRNPDYHADKGFSILGAIDLNLSSLKWKIKIEKIHGLTRNTLFVKDDTLYVLNSSLLKVNKDTGEILLRYDNEEGSVFTKPYLTPSLYTCGIQYDDGKFYYTTMLHRDTHLQDNITKDLVYSLICVDADNFNFLWGFHPVGGTSSTFPIIKDGKAYIVTHIDGLRVFDIKTGDLIGVDKSIIAWGDEKTFLYKDYYIFYNVDFKKNKAKLCAIKI